MGTLIVSHILFTTPYVIISVLPRLKNIDPSLIDASFDLGAKTFKTLKNVIIPNIKGAMFVGASIAFAISFDDFIISYLTSGSVENVSTHIYSIKRITPIVYAFGTILVLVVTSIFSIKLIVEFRKDRIANWKENIIIKNHKKIVKEEYKKIISLDSTKMNFIDRQKLKTSIYNDYDLKIIAIDISKEPIDKMRGKYEH
ncbi:MAG: ABC transporter permease subunit [Mycoplasmataceae bacterium]|nr:ABC transporter permease subunit [Mycoplasmataceae bacterium]